MENLNIDTMEDSLTLDAIEDLNLDMNEVHSLKQHTDRRSFENGLPNPAPILSRSPAKRDWNVSEETITKEILQKLGY